jgi:hypothetical protein
VQWYLLDEVMGERRKGKKGVTITISASNNFILMHFNELVLCRQLSFTPQLATSLDGKSAFSENFPAADLLAMSHFLTLSKRQPTIVKDVVGFKMSWRLIAFSQ